MSSFGYSGDNSASPGSPLPLTSVSSLVSQEDAGPIPSDYNHFIHGMHSFNTANQLHSYIERMSEPGARVNVTDVAYFTVGPNRRLIRPSSSAPFRESNGQPAILTSSVFPGPAGAMRGDLDNDSTLAVRSTSTLGLSNTPGSSLTASAATGSSRGILRSATPPPPGYERSYMAVICHLHNREQTDSLPRPLDGGFDLHGMCIGHCSICRRVVAVDSRGRAIRDF